MTGAPLWIPAFAGMTKKGQSPRSHEFPSFPRRRESIGHHSDPHGGLFLNQPNLPCLDPFFQAHLNRVAGDSVTNYLKTVIRSLKESLMSASLPKTPEQFHKIPHARLAIIGSSWHNDCVNAMVNRAQKELLALEVKPENIFIHKLPGSLELPFAAGILFEKDPGLDAILAFGVVLKGITSHDEMVLHGVFEGFMNVTGRFGKPVINEVIGVGSVEDAKKRSGDNHMNKGVEAVYALSLIHI